MPGPLKECLLEGRFRYLSTFIKDPFGVLVGLVFGVLFGVLMGMVWFGLGLEPFVLVWSFVCLLAVWKLFLGVFGVGSLSLWGQVVQFVLLGKSK